MNETFIPDSNSTKRKWYVIDCQNQKLGRLLSTIVPLLTGKVKPYYHPALDIGDCIILINAEALTLGGTSDFRKFHVYCPGRPGSSLKQVLNNLPQQIIERSIRCMMPNGYAEKNLVKRLKIYEGPNHPHIAQNPIELNLDQFEFFNYNNDI
jgi:large subunit ribosomal protein L13